jgi:multidrug transporter EmrE-like cation transporter
MQFYLQSSIVEKGVTRRQYKTSKLDVIVGCIFTDVVAWFIIVACAATLYLHGHHDIRDAADGAQALRPLAGDYAYILFSLGLFNASLFAASILPLSTAYTVCEGLGFESGVGRKFSDGADRCGRSCDPDSRASAGQDHRVFAGSQRRGFALRPDFYAAADQQKRTDGRICE